MKKIKNLIISSVICISLSAASAIPAVASQKAVTAIYVNDISLNLDVDPEIVNDRTFVPMRAIFEALGANVSWNEERKEAVASIGSNELILKIGSDIGLQNTKADMLDAAPYINGGRTMVPLRYLSEALGYEVKWDENTRTVNISIDSDHEKADMKGLSILGNKTDLSYESVLKQYDKVNPSVQRARLSHQQSSQLKTEFDEVYQWIGTYTLEQNKKALTLAKDWTAKQIMIAQAQGAYTITGDMDKISMKLAEIEEKKTDIDNKKKALETAQLKYDAGAGSPTELKKARSDIKSAEMELDGLNTELDGLYAALYGKLEYPQGKDKYKEPEYISEYKPVGEVDLEKKYEAALKEDPYIWYLEHAEANAKYNLDTYEYNIGEKSYTLTKMDLTNARINLGVTKQQLHDTVYSRYNQILQLENNISKLDEQIGMLRDDIDTLRTNYQYGAVSKNTLETALEKLSGMKYQILVLKNQHAHLVKIFDVTWLAPEYISMG